MVVVVETVPERLLLRNSGVRGLRDEVRGIFAQFEQVVKKFSSL